MYIFKIHIDCTSTILRLPRINGQGLGYKIYITEYEERKYNLKKI